MLVSVMRSVVFTRGTLHVALVISLLQPSGQEIHIRKAFNKDKVTWRVALRSERKLGHICRLESCYTNFASVIDSQFVSATATSVDLLQATRSNPLLSCSFPSPAATTWVHTLLSLSHILFAL